MTVSSTTSRADYVGNGTTLPFVVPFYFITNSHIKVTGTVAGVTTPFVEGTDYTLVGAGVFSGGTVRFFVAPANGVKLAIVRVVPITQETHYVENDDFPATSHETALDKLTMIGQQFQEQIDGITVSVAVAALAEDVVVQAASKRFNFTGDGVAVTDDGAGGVIVDVPANPTNPDFVAAGTGAVTRSLVNKGRDTTAVGDYPSLTAAVTATSALTGGGTITIPNGATPTIPASLPNIALDYLGPNASHAMYDETTQTTRASRLLRVRDAGSHPAIEHSAFSIEAQPVGSGDPAVNATDFGLSVSAVKQNWTTTNVEGQVVAINVGFRSGYFGTNAGTSNSGGDCSALIINGVQASQHASISAMESVTYFADGGSFVPGSVNGIGVQLGIIRRDQSLAVGANFTAKNGANGPAILIGNQRGDSAGDGTWAFGLQYVWDDGTNAPYVAHQINQDGSLTLAGPAGKRTFRINSGGNLEILNTAGAIVQTINETGTEILGVGASLVINGHQIVGDRIAGWGTPSGTISRVAVNVGSGAVADDVLARLNALILDLRAHGVIGT